MAKLVGGKDKKKTDQPQAYFEKVLYNLYTCL